MIPLSSESFLASYILRKRKSSDEHNSVVLYGCETWRVKFREVM
jgi:hypothetical protein